MKKLFLIMRLTVIITLVLSIQASASVYSQMTKMNMALKNTSLEEVIEVIRHQSDFRFLYNHEEIEQVQNVNVELNNATVEEILDQILKDYDLDYRVVNNVVVIVPAPGKTKQKPGGVEKQPEQKKVKYSGTVVDENGQPVPFAAVIIKGTTLGAATDENGAFEFEVPEGNYEAMVASSVGLISHQILIGNNTKFNFILRTNVAGLDEVLVTGYQTISKERATGSFNKVSEAQLEKPATLISERLIGAAAGVQSFVDADGDIKFEIRGQTSLGASSEPLVVVDGFPIEGDFSSINPNDVESVTVLKDAAAASIWGARSANGVIVVTTKKAQKGQAKVEVSSFWKFQDKLDLDYVNPLATSEETIEYEKMAYEKGMFGVSFLAPFYAISGVVNAHPEGLIAMSDRDAGLLTDDELNAKLAALAARNNKEQIRDNLLQVPFTQQYNLSVTGGTDNITSKLSVMFENDKNYFEGNKNDKFMANFRNNASITKWLDFNFLGTIQYENRDYSGVTLNEISELSPYDMLKNDDGSLTNLNHLYYYNTALYNFIPTEDFPYSDWSYNPIDEINQREFEQKQINSRVQAGLTFKLIEGLTFDSKFMYEKFSHENSRYYKGGSFAMRSMVNETSQYNPYTGGEITRQLAMGGSLMRNSFDVTNYSFRNQLNFKRTINEKHNINIIAGTEIRNRNVNNRRDADLVGYDKESGTSGRYEGADYYSDYDFINSPIRYNSYKYIVQNPMYDLPVITAQTDRYFSMYSNLAYTYNDKYTLSGSVRTDASNIISDDPKYRYSPFWSVGAGWQMHKEDFMSNLDWLDRMNVRTTYGYNGNVDRSTSVLPLIVLNPKTDIFSKDNSASVASYGNPFLRWEKTRSVDFGIDFSLFKGKLNGTVDVYEKLSSDLIVSKSIPSVHGTDLAKFNNGEMTNKGIELSLGTTLPVVGNKVVWTGNFNFSYNKNEITKLLKTYYDYVDLTAAGTSDKTRAYVEGYDANTLWSLEYAGVENRGTEASPLMLPVYKGAKGNVLVNAVPTGDDARLYMPDQGTLVAPYILGFTNHFKIYDFDLSFIVTGKFGHVYRRHAFDYPLLRGTGYLTVNNKFSEVANGDPMAIIPIPENDTRYFFYENIVPHMSYLTEDASHIRFQEVSLGYRVPSTIVSKLGFERIRVYAQVNNLGTVLFNDFGEDPEYPLGTVKPQTMYTFGFNFSL